MNGISENPIIAVITIPTRSNPGSILAPRDWARRARWHALPLQIHSLAHQYDDGTLVNTILSRSHVGFPTGFKDIIRTWQGRIDDPRPHSHGAFLNVKCLWLPMGIQHHIQIDVIF